MRDKNGPSWDAPGGAAGRLPPQYAVRNVRLGRVERSRLESEFSLPESHEFAEADRKTGPPVQDVWLTKALASRSRPAVAVVN